MTDDEVDVYRRAAMQHFHEVLLNDVSVANKNAAAASLLDHSYAAVTPLMFEAKVGTADEPNA